MRQKNIQLPLYVFKALFCYHVADIRTEENEQIIINWLKEKAVSMEERQKYARSLSEKNDSVTES